MKNTFGSLAFVVILSTILFLALNSIYMLDQRQCALVLQFGEPVAQEVDPGLKFKVPFIQQVIFFDKQIKDIIFDPYGTNSEVMAYDQKTMKLSAFAKYKITDSLRFYQTVQKDAIFQRRAVSIMESAIREVIGSIPFTDFLGSKRREYSEKITTILREQTKGFGVEIIDVRIVTLNLPTKTQSAVYARMQTDREKEAMEIRASGAEKARIITAEADKEQTILLAEAEQQSSILKGEGEAEAARIFAEAFNKDPGFFSFYKSMEAYKIAFKDNSSMFILTAPHNDFLKYIIGDGSHIKH